VSRNRRQPAFGAYHRFGIRLAYPGVLCAAFVLHSGCAVRQAPSSAGRGFWTGLRYDVEPRLIGTDPANAIARVCDDFQRISDWGFDAVVLAHHDPAFDVEVANCARDAKLMVQAWPEARTAARHPSPDRAGRQSRMAIVHSAAFFDKLPEASFGTALVQYVGAVARGQTDALIVDRFERPPGDPPGLARLGTFPEPSASTGIRSLLARAEAWGARLHRAEAGFVVDDSVRDLGLALVLLTRGERRYALVRNTSVQEFVRATVDVPVLQLGGPIRRLVEVRPWSDELPGAVISVVGDRVTFPVNLRPGDAALFEVF